MKQMSIICLHFKLSSNSHILKFIIFILNLQYLLLFLVILILVI